MTAQPALTHHTFIQPIPTLRREGDSVLVLDQTLLPSGGTYFQLARYGAISDLGDAAFCEHLTRNVGVAAIPVSAFFADGRDERVIRFCFAKNESTLAAACERLCTL